MLRYCLARLAQGLVTLWLVGTAVFFIGRVGGDPVDRLLSIEASDQQREVLRDQLGLDRPIMVQYGDFLADAARLDLGTSFRTSDPVWDLVRPRCHQDGVHR